MPWSSPKQPAKSAPKAAAKPAAKPAPKKSKAKNTKGDAVPGLLTREQSVSISVRKIDNGYLTRRSEYRNGDYVERETFTPSKPKIVIGVSAKNGEE